MACEDLAREALAPLKALADAHFHRYETRPGEFREAHSNQPDDQVVFGIDGALITAGDFRRARTAYDAIGSDVKALDELGTADEWKAKREELQDWTGSAWLAGETDDDLRPKLYSFLCGLIGWMHCAEDAARALSTHTAAGAGPVGEAVAWRPNDRERKVYEHYLSSSERGDLYVNVKRGRLGVMKPDRSHGNAFAAWMAGQELARRGIIARPVEEPGEVERDEAPQTDGGFLTKGERAAIDKLGETTALRRELAETRERLEKVEAALQPFAMVAQWLAPDVHDVAVDWPEYMAFATGTGPVPQMPTAGDLRRARAALTGDAQEAGR